MKQRIKKLLFRLLRKDPDAVVVSFLSGEPELASHMLNEIRALVPDRRHFAVTLGEAESAGVQMIRLAPGGAWQLYRQLRKVFRTYRIGLAPVLFSGGREFAALRTAAFFLAPGKVLAYNSRRERHHLRLRTAIASVLFLRGVPLDRIFLRPRWLFPCKRDRTVCPRDYRILEGRPLRDGRPRVAVLSPYFPYPLSHGGAVRIFNLLRHASCEADIFLFAFSEDGNAEEHGPVLDFCAKVILVPKPRYREPRWSSLLPPEVHEYESPVMRGLLARFKAQHGIRLLQTEYTSLARYGGDILVEHDVTFDLYRQTYERTRTLASWWDWYRWRRFETRVVPKFRRAVVMSDKDANMLGVASSRVIPNGVDLSRFRPVPEKPGHKLLFIGSFRHFPNVVAYRFFVEQVWPRLRDRMPELDLTVVAGPDPMTYWSGYSDKAEPQSDPRIRMLEFVRDVRPLYEECNVVIVPTLMSAGTNVKVLEAMAMERVVVSTTSGCAGLGLEHGVSAWIADDPAGFAAGVEALLTDSGLRRRLAREARVLAEHRYDWEQLSQAQISLWKELLEETR